MAFDKGRFEEYFCELKAEVNILSLEDICPKGKGIIISGPFGSNISSKFFVEDGIPVIRGNNLSLGMDKFFDEGFVYVTEEKADSLNTYAMLDDLIFTAAGTIGQVGIITDKCRYEKYVISNKQLRARVDKNIVNPLYAYYWFASKKMQDYIILQNTGSTIPLINLSVLKGLPIPVPSFKTQNKIVEILDTLDKKIDTNNQINRNLSEQCFAIFHSMFDEPICESGMVEFGDVASFKYGTMPKKDKICDVGYPLFSGYKIVGYYPEKMFDEPQLIIVARGVGGTGDIKYTPENCYLTNLAIAIMANKRVYEEYLYHYLMCQDMKILNTGSAQPQITVSSLEKYKLYYPDENTAKEFSDIVIPLRDRIRTNRKENQKLEELRDSLLPKLMSGELDVSELDI